jgi:hypothetical protein
VCEAIVGNGIAPMLEQAQRIGVGGFQRCTGRLRSDAAGAPLHRQRRRARA